MKKSLKTGSFPEIAVYNISKGKYTHFPGIIFNGSGFMNENLVMISGYASTVMLSFSAVYYFLLMLGLPLAKASWGGKYDILPKKLRVSCGISIMIMLLVIYVFLSKSGIIAGIMDENTLNVFSWLFTVYFAFNTVMNVLSKSVIEKFMMGILSAAVFASGLFISLWGRGYNVNI